jgi:hypothetical protein
MRDSLSPSYLAYDFGKKDAPARVNGHRRFETQCQIIEEEGILTELA